MTFELPSSKWWASTVLAVAISLVAVIDAAEVQGVDLPPWVYMIGAVLSPIVVYVKRENRPSSSGVAAALYPERARPE